jgi:hypothetical protein
MACPAGRHQLHHEVEARGGERGYSAYVNRALETQLNLDRLREYLDAADAELGSVPNEVMAQVYADIEAADAEISFVR